jgi:hypothetical protein
MWCGFELNSSDSGQADSYEHDNESLNPSSAMRFLTHTEDLFDVTDSLRISISFSLECSGFTPQMALLVDTCLHIFVPHFFALMLMHFVLLVRFVAQISTSFSILVPRMCVLYRNFYCIFLSPAQLAWSQMIK